VSSTVLTKELAMKRVVSAFAASTLTLGLLSVSPTASAVPGCPDPSEAVPVATVFGNDHLPLGPRETVEVSVEMFARTSCLALYPASARAVTPARVIPVVVTPTQVDRETGFTTFRGTLVVDASHLLNADAGEWDFEFSAGDVSTVTRPVWVQKRTKLSFDAGPEPLRRNHRLTFHGTLRAADWQRSSYRGIRGQQVVIFALGSQTTPKREALAELQTKRHGRYRVRTEVAGPNRFQAVFRGGDLGLYQSLSRIDTVAART
jgi:hypothetical protein